MVCTRCEEKSLPEELRCFWRQVPHEDKRQFTTGAGGLGGVVMGWGAAGLLGGLFLGGCLGGIAGIMRYRVVGPHQEPNDV